MVKYIPNRGDIVWLEFDPQVGKEIQKTQPAVVISPHKYNMKTGMGLFMPVTSQIKGYPFEVVINENSISGAVLCDQIRSLDWQARKARLIMHLSAEVMLHITKKLMLLIND